MNIINAFTHKAYDWKYEKEWRIIRLLPVNKRRLTNIQINKGEYAKMPKPAEIIMGSRSCYDSDNIIAEYCKNNNILLSRMYMKGNKYRLYKKVLPFNLFDPPAVDLDKLMKEYLKTDAAKKDLKIIRKQNKVGEKQRYVSMKDFL